MKSISLKKSLYILLSFILFTKIGKADNDTTFQTIKANVGGSINKVSDGFSYLNNNRINYSHSHQKMRLNIGSSFVYGESLDKVTNRDFNAISDINYYLHKNKRWYGWGLGNISSIYSLKINHQFQLGGGIAFHFEGENKLRLNISNGLLFEQSEIISGEGELINYQTLRNSFRLRFSSDIGKYITVSTMNMWQPSLTIKNDFIFNTTSEVLFKINEVIHFTTAFTYNKISRNNKENLLFTYGITYNHAFKKIKLRNDNYLKELSD